MGLSYQEKFKEAIYEPYLEAWTIMKFLRDANLKDDNTWDEYVKKCDAFGEKYGTKGYYGSLCRVLVDCGSEVWKIVEGENKHGSIRKEQDIQEKQNI